jgi:D-3-phosphoglycerate dehydrogenase
VRITVTTTMGKRSFAGTVVAGTPRIVEVKGMELDAPFSPTMLYVNNQDKPGFIGAVGALLSEAQVNIATFNLGRVAAGEDAICLIGVDQEPDDGLVGRIRALPHVKEARILRF